MPLWFPPDMGQADPENFIYDRGDCLLQILFTDKTPLNIHKIAVFFTVVTSDKALDAGIGSQGVEAQKKTFLQGGSINGFSLGNAFKMPGKVDAKIGFL